MWWLAIPAVAIGLRLVYEVVSDEERQACLEWENKREQVKRTIESHQADIQEHICKAQTCYDFCKLVDLHHSSVIVANESYKLLKDSNESLSAMKKMLDESKKQINKLKKEKQEKLNSLNTKKNNKSSHQYSKDVKAINKNISLLYDFRKSIFEDFEKVKQQRNNFFIKVRELNNKTHQLKEYIRVHCGNGGKVWYARLENRSNS